MSPEVAFAAAVVQPSNASRQMIMPVSAPIKHSKTDFGDLQQVLVLVAELDRMVQRN